MSFIVLVSAKGRYSKCGLMLGLLFKRNGTRGGCEPMLTPCRSTVYNTNVWCDRMLSFQSSGSLTISLWRTARSSWRDLIVRSLLHNSKLSLLPPDKLDTENLTSIQTTVGII